MLAIGIDRPGKLNALSLAMLQRLAEEIEGAAAGEYPPRALILHGEGEGAFSSGFDLEQFASLPKESRRQTIDRAFGRVCRALRRSAAVSIAEIGGHCIGGGCQLAISCDLRYGAETASFAMPPVRHGVVYSEAAALRFVEELGPGAARELFLTARPIGAEKAVRIGLLHDALPAAELRSHVRDLAERLAGYDPETLAETKKMLSGIGRRR